MLKMIGKFNFFFVRLLRKIERFDVLKEPCGSLLYCEWVVVKKKRKTKIRFVDSFEISQWIIITNKRISQLKFIFLNCQTYHFHFRRNVRIYCWTFSWHEMCYSNLPHYMILTKHILWFRFEAKFVVPKCRTTMLST